MDRPAVANFTEYTKLFPAGVQRLLREMRTTIRKAAPDAEEVISYRIPAFKQGKTLVWFAAQSRHIGLYPGVAAIAAFKKDLAPYKVGKGTVQFPFDEPLPVALITRIVKFRLKGQGGTAGRKPKRKQTVRKRRSTAK
ncbi:MAG: iron chaperone [Vulcanimicrobiaceae bacterium]